MLGTPPLGRALKFSDHHQEAVAAGSSELEADDLLMQC